MSFPAGIVIDQNLIAELKSPGVDQRSGVNIVARLPADIVPQVTRVQEALRRREPGQYFYPAPDLHLTILEVVSDTEPERCEPVFNLVRPHIAAVIAALPPIELSAPRVRLDAVAGSLVYEHGGSLDAVRRQLSQALTELVDLLSLMKLRSERAGRNKR